MAKNLDVWSIPSGQLLWDLFFPVSPEDMNRTVGEVKPITCRLDPCPAWLIKEANWAVELASSVTNTSLLYRVVPQSLKEAVIWPLLQKPNLYTKDLSNY